MASSKRKATTLHNSAASTSSEAPHVPNSGNFLTFFFYLYIFLICLCTHFVTHLFVLT